MQDSGGLKANPIIERLKACRDGSVQKLSGFVGTGEGGKVEIYPDLAASTCIELGECDVVYVVGSDKPTEPSTLFIRDDARIEIRHRSSLSALREAAASGCGCEGGEKVGRAALAAQSGFGSIWRTIWREVGCFFGWIGCLTDCDKRYPEGSDNHVICRSSCGNVYGRCRTSLLDSIF
jgi:hypothetical protein